MIHNKKTIIKLAPAQTLAVFMTVLPEDVPPVSDETGLAFMIHEADAERIMAVISAYRGIQNELKFLLMSGVGMIAPTTATDEVPNGDNN